MNDIKEGIQYIFQTRNTMTFAVSGTGHTAMECAIFNAVEAGESVLTAVNGIWGERAAEMAERIGKTWCTFLTFLFSFAQHAFPAISQNKILSRKKYNSQSGFVSHS